MAKLISFELHKIFRAKSFYIWMLASVALSVLFLLMTFGVAQLNNNMPEATTVIPSEDGVLSTLKFFAKSPIAFCLMMLICSFICNDFENGILKNIISKGYNRRSVFSAKFITVFIISIIITVINALCAYSLFQLLFTEILVSFTQCLYHS